MNDDRYGYDHYGNPDAYPYDHHDQYAYPGSIMPQEPYMNPSSSQYAWTRPHPHPSHAHAKHPIGSHHAPTSSSYDQPMAHGSHPNDALLNPYAPYPSASQVDHTLHNNMQGNPWHGAMPHDPYGHPSSSAPNPPKRSDVQDDGFDIIDKFDPNQYTSAFNMVLIGPPRQGKSTIIANFLSLFRDRFVFVYIFAEPDTAEELKNIVPSAYIYTTFEPELIQNLIHAVQYVFDNTGTKIPILLYFDDMMMEKKVKNHPVFNSLFKTIHHLDIYVWICIHRLYDLHKEQRPAMHLVGITGKIADELMEIHKEIFSTSIHDLHHFRRAYHEIITGKGQCLFHSKLGSGNRIGDAISYFKSIPRSELAPFTLMHPDVYYLLAMFAKNMQDRTVNLSGLASHDAYRSALNLPKAEGQVHPIQPPVQTRKNVNSDRPAQPLYFRE